MKLTQKLKNWLIKDLFCTVDQRAVITVAKKEIRGMNGQPILTETLLINGEPVSEIEMNSLREEAKFYKKTRLWVLLTETVKDQAMKVMFNKSETFNDMYAGKMMLYNISVQKNIIDKLERLGSNETS